MDAAQVASGPQPRGAAEPADAAEPAAAKAAHAPRRRASVLAIEPAHAPPSGAQRRDAAAPGHGDDRPEAGHGLLDRDASDVGNDEGHAGKDRGRAGN